MTDARKSSQRRISVKDTGQSTKNLPGGSSAVVPPDPMPNSEVKRLGERSPEEDKSAGSGFARCAATARRGAGRTPAINCQASDK
ncbi:hypothetical protein CFA78_14655 [Salmonella enterica subsp. enterica serovar Heidelberg]|nr:hypothetical protein CE493_11785 [Salmonella enterica subsp. enterica serovar Heidelberg]OZI02231.1 hypothetical protein CFA78_14655 [Salmonella enterica subsp. enterica serovar Heidelberg]